MISSTCTFTANTRSSMAWGAPAHWRNAPPNWGSLRLALTDHGVMHGAIEFSRHVREAGVKPLLGVEAYLTTSLADPWSGRDPEQDRSRYHLLLLAENMTGYRNLLKICSARRRWTATITGRASTPTIWPRNSEGLICTSGCLAAELPTLFKNGDERQALERLHWYQRCLRPGPLVRRVPGT